MTAPIERAWALLTARLGKEPAAPSWSLELPLIIISLYLGSTFLYPLVEQDFPGIIYLGPQLFFAACIMALRLSGKISFADVGFSFTLPRQTVILTLILLLLPYVAVAVLTLILYALNPFLHAIPAGTPLFTVRPLALDWSFALALVVMAPLFEEIIFRGILLPPLIKELGLAKAIVIDAVVFMAAHLKFHPGALVLGLIAAALYAATNSLVPLIAFHVACNASGILIPKYCPFLFRFIRFLFQ